MTSTFLRSTLAALACTAAVALAGPAMAAMVNLKAELNGAAEVPPNPSTAKGSMTAAFDTTTKN